LDTVKDYLNELDQQPEDIKTSTLLEMSDLSGEDVENFSDIWSKLESEIKVKILKRLTELAEYDVQLDFTSICKLCLSDPEPIVRKSALDGLWELQDRTFIQPLIEILINDTDSAVKSAAAIALNSFAQMHQNGKLIERDSSKIFDALMQTIEKGQEENAVISRTVEAIGYFSGQQVEDTLTKFHRNKNSQLRQSAIFAMGRNAQPKWLDMILKDFNDANPAIRFEALNAAGLLGDESTVPQIIPFTKDTDTQIKLAALTSLGYIGGELAKREILTCIEDDDENVKDAAISALANIDFEQDPLGIRFNE
jgi:HEAT repeat protein